MSCRPAESVPCGRAIELNLPLGCLLFQDRERRMNSRVEVVSRDGLELGLRIMEIKKVDGFKAQVNTAALQLVGEKIRREAVHPAYNIGGVEGWRGMGHQVTGLGAD